MVPMGGNKLSPNPGWSTRYPDVYMSTGLIAENHARKYGDLARGAGRLRAAQPSAGVAAIDSGSFADEIVPLPVARRVRRRRHGAAVQRADASTATRVRAATRRLEALAKLKPAFHASGTVTAGNSSQTSDGAAAVVVMWRRGAASSA